MEMTVERVLEIATDSVTLINDVNTNGASSEYLLEGLSQSEVNNVVQKNVFHLETILAYDGSSTKPDVAGRSADKSSYTAATTTGKNYITANS